MIRPYCIWLEGFTIQVLVDGSPELRGQAIALHDGRQRIRQADALARAAGVVPGMRVKEATGRLATLALVPFQPGLPRQQLRQLAAGLLDLSPRVGCWYDEEIFIDLAPVLHLHAGEEALVQLLVRRLARDGYEVRIAVADSVAAARLAVRHEAEPGRPVHFRPQAEARFVNALPPRALAVLPEFFAAAAERRLFAYLGLRCLRDLARSAPQAQRDLLRGDDADILLYAQRSSRLAERIESVRSEDLPAVTVPFFPSVIALDPILHHLGEILASLRDDLFRKRLSIVRLRLVLVTEDLDERSFDIISARPTRAPRLLVDLARLKLADISLSRPVVELRVQLGEVARMTIARHDLLAAHRRTEQVPLDELRSRLDTRLGRTDVLFQVHLVPTFLPEQAWECIPATGVPALVADSGSQISTGSGNPGFDPHGIYGHFVERVNELPSCMVVQAAGRRPQAAGKKWDSSLSPTSQFSLFDPETGTMQEHVYFAVQQSDFFVLARDRTPRPEVIGIYD